MKIESDSNHMCLHLDDDCMGMYVKNQNLIPFSSFSGFNTHEIEWFFLIFPSPVHMKHPSETTVDVADKPHIWDYVWCV